jgi:protein O-GlcNAc transferase
MKQLDTIYSELNIHLKSYNYPKIVYFFYKLYLIDGNPRHLVSIGDVYKDCNKYNYAIKYYKKININHKLNFLSNFLCLTTFPIVYKNQSEIDLVIKNFNFFLKKCEEILIKPNSNNISKEDFIIIINRSIFYLAYSNINIIHYQERYQQLLKKICDKFLPQYSIKKKNVSKIEKIAFCARDLDPKHTVIKLFKFLMDYFVEKNYEVFFYSYKKKNFYFENNKNVKFFYADNFQKIQLNIIENKIDILIYLDIGMSRYNTILSNYRIAKIQMSLMGHPVTSGSKEIDYFITSELMEPKTNQKNYTEKLIFFPGLGLNYFYNHIVNYNFTDNPPKNFVTCLQPPQKISPKTINFFKKIIDKYNNLNIVFLGSENKYINLSLKKILEAKINSKNFTILNPLDHENYCKLIYNSKIILDSVDWSGGNSSLEAFYFNKPIITFQGYNLRSNTTSAFLKVLNLEELICKNEDHFVEVFDKLYSNNDFYVKCVNKIKKNKSNFSNQVSNIFLDNLINKIKSEIAIGRS